MATHRAVLPGKPLDGQRVIDPAKIKATGPQSHQGTATQSPSDKPKPQLPPEQYRTAPQIPTNDSTHSLEPASLTPLTTRGLDTQNPLQSTTDHPKQPETLQPIIDQDPEVPESAVLVPTCAVNEIAAPVAVKETDEATVEEPYPGFEAQVQQILKDKDAIWDESDLQKLRQILYQ
ncbi:hypothetical protein Q8A67_002960 [Cirrhinus molitorella]|uniref:Uncharacterized protein n=1 Tax=Cirrhinus molitorella TaxID=172907 RepID=A0AA88QDI9_9TELE|nr:hypothetical protein Q8A67_002960 [Cirrhinus molitorella]